MPSFDGKVAIITGGASGIGYALAEAMLGHGANVVIADRRVEALDAARSRLGAKVLAVPCDVSCSADVESLAAAAVSRFGKINLLFNNAGIFVPSVTWETSLDEYNRVIGVNLMSVVHGIRAIVPRMIAQGDQCHVINTASGAGLTVTPGFVTYSMTKHAVVALTEALYLDLMTQKIVNIGVTLVMPGAVRSEILWSDVRQQLEESDRDTQGILGPLGKFMHAAINEGMPPDSVAKSILTAIQRNNLYVLPNFAENDALRQTLAVATGRARGHNPYPELMAQLLPLLDTEATAKE